ncbi:MAG: helix-turn-helix domain-containing protein [Acidobacteriota bacterium]|jgi:transcriptional regulator with XRE-family HTH domain
MELLFFSPHATLASVMPKPSKLSLAPLPASDETPGQRLARLRRERGFTQVELADRTGLVQTLVSDYERGKLRLNADMILRFATALDVSTDDLLQPASGPKPARKTSRRVLQRLERIEALPAHVQTTVLKSLYLMLKSVAPAKRQQVTR